MKFLFRSLSHSGCWQQTSLLEAWLLPPSHRPFTHTHTQKEKKARPQVLSITHALIRVGSKAPFCTLLTLSSFFNPLPHSFHSHSPAPTLSFSPVSPNPFSLLLPSFSWQGVRHLFRRFSSHAFSPLLSLCSPLPLPSRVWKLSVT